MTAKLEYFYDFSSPYAYLASRAAEEVAHAHGAELVWRPFLLGAVFKAIGGEIVPIAAATDQKRKVLHADIHRYAEWRGLAFAWPTIFPMNTIAALRVVLQLEGDDHARAARRIFDAYWGEDRDISDLAVLRALLDEIGLDGAALIAGCADAEVKERLKAATAEAVARGVCGAPSFFVGDLLFWGQDRLETLVARALDGWVPRM